MTETRNIICYGAGANSKKAAFDLMKRGITPVCFADANEKKQHTKIAVTFGAFTRCFDILPLERAIAKYPDYEIFISTAPDVISNVTDYLLSKGVPLSRLFKDDCEYRMGCPQVGTRLSVYAGCFQTCCHLPPVQFRATSNFTQDLNRFKDECININDKFKKGERTTCDKCPQYKQGYYPIRPEISLVSFDTGLKNSGCNVKCCYCHSDRQLADKSVDITLYDCVKALAENYGGGGEMIRV